MSAKIIAVDELATRALSEATALTLRRFIPIFKEKSRLIFLPNYGCLESLSGQSSMPTGL